MRRLSLSRVVSALSLLGVVALPAVASAQEASPVAEYRTAVMQSIRHHNGALRAILNGDVAFDDHAVHHARAIHGLATLAADIFPEGSGEGTRARPEIWTDGEGFREKLQAFRTAAAVLAEAAEGGDEEAMREAGGAVGQSCRGCHTDYRAEAN